jgi:hypothetical protein
MGRLLAVEACVRIATQEKVHTVSIVFMTTSLLTALLISAQSAAPAADIAQAAPPADTVSRARTQARAAEARFERLARSMAPYTCGAPAYASTCDEIVGRFCLRFDSAAVSTRPSQPEVGRVVDERRAAIETLRRYFSLAPAERTAAGPLVRLLVLDGRAAEAVSVARAFAALSHDTLWTHLLQGLALNAAGAMDDAEREFVRALMRMDESARREWTDPQWLLHYSELRQVRRLSPAARADYERRFWIVSDPLWLTDPNESWVEHMSRHVEARLLAQVPMVAGMLRWGRDLDELTVRYGTPSARSQIRGNQPWDRSSFIEYFDTAQRAYSPDKWLAEGLPPPPMPGDKPYLYTSRARAGYALRTVHRLIDLPHQVTRFLAGDSVVVRVDGALVRPDTTASGQPIIGLFAYDSAFTRRVQNVRPGPAWDADTVVFTLSVRAPGGAFIYSVEALDTAAAFAARARYSLDAFVPEDGPVVSDVLVTAPFGELLPGNRSDPLLRPLHTLIVPMGTTVGLYAEVYRVAAAGPDALRLEFALEPAEGPGVLAQFARWIGRAVGLVQPDTDPRVAWREEVEAGVHPVAVNLPIEPRRPGRHVLTLRVTDLRTGRTAETRRYLMVR